MPSRTRVVCAAIAVEDGERLEPVPVGTGRLPSALDATRFGLAVRVEVFAEHDVVGNDDSVDAGLVGCARQVEEVVPTAGIFGRERAQAKP